MPNLAVLKAPLGIMGIFVFDFSLRAASLCLF